MQQPFKIQSSATVSSVMRKKKRAIIQTSLVFFKRVDRIESRKEPEPVPLMLSVSETASPVAADSSVLPSPTLHPHSSQ